MKSLWQDIQYTACLLAKNPAFTGIAVLTLALGIGAYAAIFSFVNAAPLRPLPYPWPEQLVSPVGTRQADLFMEAEASFPDHQDWTRESKTFQSFAGYSRGDMTLSAAGTPEIVHGARAIVSKSFVDHYIPEEQAVGKRVRFTYSADQPYREIVGVVGNESVQSLDSAAVPITYASTNQGLNSGYYVVVRGKGNPATRLGSVRTALAGIDPELPMAEPRTMERVIEGSNSVFLRRYPSYLIGSLALLAVVPAMAGLSGQISYGVTQRTREIGIRMALGTDKRDILKIILRQGAGVVGLGMLLGICGVLALTGVVRGMLFGIAPTDPSSLVAVCALPAITSIFACWIPARRASRVDPVIALRYE